MTNCRYGVLSTLEHQYQGQPTRYGRSKENVGILQVIKNQFLITAKITYNRGQDENLGYHFLIFDNLI